MATSDTLPSKAYNRVMLQAEADTYRQLQTTAFNLDNYVLPLFNRLYKCSPKSTKLSQLQCIPILGNLLIFCISTRFLFKTMSTFGCLQGATKFNMVGLTLLMFVVGFIPFLGVWMVYRIKPLYQCWRWASWDIDRVGLYCTGSTDEIQNSSADSIYQGYNPKTILDDTSILPPVSNTLSGDSKSTMDAYGSFCPMRTHSTRRKTDVSVAESDGRTTGHHSFASMRASTIPEEAEFLKGGYMQRQSYLDNYPLKN